MGDIRKERDKLDAMLARETATREMLQEQLVGIEVQVDSLEEEGTQLLEQLGQELDRQLTMKHEVSDEFQVSLEELERLLFASGKRNSTVRNVVIREAHENECTYSPTFA